MRLAYATASKYRNKPTTLVDGTRVASKKEARGIAELRLLLKVGKIRSLMEQAKFPIAIDGKHICTYIADADYIDGDGVRHVVDWKSPATAKNPTYRLKKKLVAAIYGIQIEER